MARKKFARKKSKYEDDAVITTATVCKIDYKNEPVGKDGTFKTVFYCPSHLCPEGRMCIAYGRYSFDVGDEVTMKGRFNDGVFLVWSMYVSRSKEKLEQAQTETDKRIRAVIERLKSGTNPETNNQSVS